MRLLMFNLAADAEDPILGFATRWVTALAKRVDYIHLVTMLAGRFDVPDNVRVYSLGKEKGYSEPQRALEFYRHLIGILRSDHVDACFSHMNPIFTVMGGPLLKAKGIPIVTWYAHRNVTGVLKASHLLSNVMVSVNEGSYPYRHDKFMPLGHGIDTEQFSPNGSTPDEPPLLLSVGRLSPIKNLTTLLEAVAILTRREYRLRCVLVGDAPERDKSYLYELRRKVAELDIESTVEFAGAIPNDKVGSWYRSGFAHINCAPGNNAVDKAVLEAMACGIPSLSSALSFRDTMGEWAEYLLFQEGSAEDLAGKLAALLDQPSQTRVELGKYLRERVIQMHSLDKLADELVCILRKGEKVNL